MSEVVVVSESVVKIEPEIKEEINDEFENEDQEIDPPATIFLQPNFEDEVNVKQEKDPLSVNVEDISVKEKNDSDSGAENVIIPDGPFNQQPTGRCMPINQSGTTSIYGTPSETIKFQPQNPQVPKSEKHFCLKCRTAFSSISNLKQHMRFHDDSQKYKCSYCNYSAETSKLLNIHVCKHAEERPYKCPDCTYRCKLKNNLIKHARMHWNDKPYQCLECDFKSHFSSSLIRHRRIHTGEKPYECLECDYKTNQSGHLRKHLRTHR